MNYSTKTVYSFGTVWNIYQGSFEMSADWDMPNLLCKGMTLAEIPTYGKYQIPQMNPDKDEWTIIPDLRFAAVWYKEGGKPVPIDKLVPGVSMEDLNCIDVAPPEFLNTYNWDEADQKWVEVGGEERLLLESRREELVSGSIFVTREIERYEDEIGSGLPTTRTPEFIVKCRKHRLVLRAYKDGDEVPALPFGDD